MVACTRAAHDQASQNSSMDSGVEVFLWALDTGQLSTLQWIISYLCAYGKLLDTVGYREEEERVKVGGDVLGNLRDNERDLNWL